MASAGARIKDPAAVGRGVLVVPGGDGAEHPRCSDSRTSWLGWSGIVASHYGVLVERTAAPCSPSCRTGGVPPPYRDVPDTGRLRVLGWLDVRQATLRRDRRAGAPPEGRPPDRCGLRRQTRRARRDAASVGARTV